RRIARHAIAALTVLRCCRPNPNDKSQNDQKHRHRYLRTLKVEVLPRRQVLSGETNSEHLRFDSAGYVERLAVNDVVALRGELPQHPNEMVETSSMLVERAVLQTLLKHRHLGPERLVVKSSVHLICIFL